MRLAADPDIGARLTRLDVVPARPARYGETGEAAPPGGARTAGGPGGGAALRPPGRGDRPAPGRPERRPGHRHRVGQVAVLPGARSPNRSCPAGRTPPSSCSRPRPWPTTSSAPSGPGWCRGCGPWPTTATRRPRSGPRLRRTANVVLTNPEMLHAGILPYHDRWATFLMRLRYVVVDELHTLRGIFGSHVAHLLRRLRRVCLHYGAEPAFCFASATIGNPAALAAELCGLPVEPSTTTDRPRGTRAVALLDRPMVERGPRPAGVGHRRGRRPPGPSGRPRPADDRLLPQPPQRRAGGPPGPTTARGDSATPGSPGR